MYPTQHLILGIIFAGFVFYLFPIIGFVGFWTIVLSSFLIDVDHYFFYLFMKKDFSVNKAYKWFDEKFKKRLLISRDEKKKHRYEIYIFHGIEFWILLFALAYFSNFLFLVFLGVMFHMFLDFAAIIYFNEPLLLKSSVIYSLARNRNKKDLL